MQMITTLRHAFVACGMAYADVKKKHVSPFSPGLKNLTAGSPRGRPFVVSDRRETWCSGVHENEETNEAYEHRMSATSTRL